MRKSGFNHPMAQKRLKATRQFAESVIMDLWRFDSVKQFEILQMMDENKRDELTRKDQTFSCLLSRIELDEITHVATMMGLSSSQLVMMVFRSFKDTVFKNHCPVPYFGNGFTALPDPSDIPESMVKIDREMLNLGIPTQSAKLQFIQETQAIEEELL